MKTSAQNSVCALTLSLHLMIVVVFFKFENGESELEN